MARVVIHRESKPIEIKVGEKSVWICRCGMTTNPPYCSGKHRELVGEQENELYIYKEGRRYKVEIVIKD